MKLLSLQIKNKEKFIKGITINFKPNMKRKDNMSQISKGVFNYVGIFGKNASGKTSLLNNIITYFANIDNETLSKRETNQFLYNDILGINSQLSLLAEGVWDVKTKDTKFDKLIDEQIMKNPTYTATFVLNNGKIIKHTIKIQQTNNTRTSSEELEVDGITYDIKNQNRSGGSSLFHDFNTKNIFGENTALDISERKEFSGYVKNTLENIYISNSSWAKEIENKWKQWSDNVEIEKKQAFLNYAKRLDANFVDILIDDTDNSFFVRIKFANGFKRIKIDRLSAGTRSSMVYFMRLLNIGMSTNGGLMIQDELEARVHDEIAKDLLDVINHFDLNAQIIFTSHMPKIFDNWFRQDAVYFIENNENIIDLHNIADRYGERPDKLISSVFKSHDYMSPGGN